MNIATQFDMPLHEFHDKLSLMHVGSEFNHRT